MELFWVIVVIAYFVWLVWKPKNRPPAARPGSTSTREQVVNCPSCGQRNRLREIAGSGRYQCGSCHTDIPNPFVARSNVKIESGPTFRPSPAKKGRTKNIAFRDTTAIDHLPTSTELAGIVDAFTGEALNPALGLFQCGKCKVYYHTASFNVVRSENGGQCVACLSTSIHAVAVSGSRASGRSRTEETPLREAPVSNYRPDTVTLFNYRDHVGRVVTFQGFVPKVLASRQGRDFAVMFENLEWKTGFKVIVFRRHLTAMGGIPFVRSLSETLSLDYLFT